MRTSIANARLRPRRLGAGVLGLMASLCLLPGFAAAQDPVDPPVNDDFADATALSGDRVTRDEDSNLGATKQAAEPDHAGIVGGASVWYRWTAPASRPVVVDTFGSAVDDTLLAVYRGDALASIEVVKANDDSGVPGDDAFHSRLSFDAEAGRTYRIAVDSSLSRQGDLETGGIALHLRQLPPPPQTEILTGPSGTVPSSQTTAEFTFSGGETADDYQCRLDSDSDEAWTACSTPLSLPNLEQGEHTLDVRAFNDGGVDSTPARREWTIGAPSPPPDTDIQIAPSGELDYTQTTAEISFVAYGRSRGFECRLDGALWSRCSSPAVLRNLGIGQHTFEVRGISISGVPDSTPDSATWKILPPPAPETSITSAPELETSDRDAAFTFSTSGVVDRLECRLDSSSDSAWTICGSPVTFQTLSFGAHRLEARAVNAGGPDATPAVHEWTILRPSAPDTTLLDGPSGTVSESEARFEFTGSGRVDGFECRLDSPDAADWFSCASPRTIRNLDDGEHTMEIRAINAGGADPSPVSRTWTVDTRPALPGTRIDSAPAVRTNSTDAAFSFSAIGTASGFECNLDATGWQSCESPLMLSGLELGTHELAVRALNARGADASPATHEWTITSEPPAALPDTVITKGAPKKIVTKSSNVNVKVSFAAIDPLVTDFECQLDGGAWKPCASPRTTIVKAATKAKRHTFAVRAIDEAGQADATPASSTFTVQRKKPKKHRRHRR